MLVGTRSRDALAAPACRKGGAAACADGEHGVPDPLDVNSHGTRGQVYIYLVTNPPCPLALYRRYVTNGSLSRFPLPITSHLSCPRRLRRG